MHAVAPDAHWNLPAEHAEQTLEPLEAVIVPGSQRVCSVAPVEHADPAGQSVQSSCEAARIPLK